MKVRTIAFYLPQYHRIPENDEWWGEGFTEWTNVLASRPQFEGHVQPVEPGELGFYSLDDQSTRAQQSKLARDHGIDGFCIYFYWFGGRRLLERPLEDWRRDDTALPYCLSWANESWTRRWDGKSREVLMEQSYVEGFEEALYRDLEPHFLAPHYMKMDGRPILVVHRVDLIPNPVRTANALRALARSSGIDDLYLIAAETRHGIRPGDYGFDAVVEFPPVGANTLGSALIKPLKGVSPEFRGRLMSYVRTAKRFMRRRDPMSFTRHRGVMPAWDNTPRRKSRSTIYVGSNSTTFGEWYRASRRVEEARGERGLVFVNAWNEWAEGAHLEPDSARGVSYLLELAGVSGESVSDPLGTQESYGRVWSAPQLRSIVLAAAGSTLAVTRRAKDAVARVWRP